MATFPRTLVGYKENKPGKKAMACLGISATMTLIGSPHLINHLVICIVQVFTWFSWLVTFLVCGHVFLCMCSVLFCFVSCVQCSKPLSTLQIFTSPVSRDFKVQNKLTRNVSPTKLQPSQSSWFLSSTPNLSPDRFLCFLQVRSTRLSFALYPGYMEWSRWSCYQGQKEKSE